MNRNACEWKIDDDGIWQTGCGEFFVFEADGPAENDFHFCPFCGQKLNVESEGENAQN